MGIRRRDFLKMSAAGIAVAGLTPLSGNSNPKQEEKFDPLNEQGIHPILEKDHPYIFIDSCMQIWPDAQYHKAHRHGVTTYGVTAWDPHKPLDQALEEVMYWHYIARKYPGLSIVFTVEDIKKAKANKKATLLLSSQCGDFIDNKLHRIEAMYRLGLRVLMCVDSPVI